MCTSPFLKTSPAPSSSTSTFLENPIPGTATDTPSSSVYDLTQSSQVTSSIVEYTDESTGVTRNQSGPYFQIPIEVDRSFTVLSLSLFQTSDFLLRTICRYVCYVPLWNLTPATSYSFIAGSLTLLSYNEIYHSHCDSGSGWSLEWSKRQRFRTAAADNSPYTFLAGGDIGAYDSTLAVYSLSLFLI